MNNTVLITGATGFIGKNLIFPLARIRTVKILARSTSNIELFRENKNIEIGYGDLENNIGIDEALKNVETVIHCAARTIGKNLIEYYRTNTTGTTNLIMAMKKKNMKKILFLSSHAVCGPCLKEKPLDESDQPEPISFYGITKKIAEDTIRKSGINFIILRPVAVYGPHDFDILKYIKLLNNGICPIIGFGEKYINLIYVADLVQLIITLIKANKFLNRTYFVNDGNCYSVKEVLDEIANALNKKSFKIYVPEKVALFYGLLNDIFLPQQKRLIWRDKVRELAKDKWLCCNERIKTECHFKPNHTLKQGIKKTIDWYRNNELIK
jgi:nucleoside-diphosphate-sugar epimerase